MEEKIYGTSVVNREENQSNSAFPSSDKLSESEIDALRSTMKDTDKKDTDEVTKVYEERVTDAITGVTSSNECESYDKVNDIIKEREIKGKRINNSGMELIKSVINRYPTSEEQEKIAQYFDTVENERALTTEGIEEAFPEEVIHAIKNTLLINNKENKYNDVLHRFAESIYTKYTFLVEYNDDMKTLSKIYQKIDEEDVERMSDKLEHNEALSKEELDKFDSIFDIQLQINEFLAKSKSKHLDERNNKLRQSYTTDDIDIYIVEEIAETLEEATSFKRIYEKLDLIIDLVRKEYKHEKDVDKIIESWIDDLRTDPQTIYTFPVNDFLSLSESRVQFHDYIVGCLLMDMLPKDENGMPIVKIEKSDSDKISPIQLARRSGVTESVIADLAEKCRFVIYIMAKTFKVKKIKTEKDRRIVSYTLDMVSKLSDSQTRAKFTEMMNNIYNVYLGKK